MKSGNFIDQMFIYNKLREFDNTIQRYGGIHEVVRGEFSQNRAEKKYESHIEKILAWPIENRWNKELSHFSLQGFCTYLNKDGRVIRSEELDDRYYPFVLEFESNDSKNYFDVICEAAIYYQELVKNYNVDPKDIVITITPGKSIYIWVNPKAFGLVMGKYVHRIYTEMYKHFKKELGLKYVDESVVNSSYRLIKTPGSYYKGGYVNYITCEEMMQLMTGQKTRKELTKHQRDIRKLYLPGVQSLKLSNLYKKAEKKVKKEIKEFKVKDINPISLPGDKNITRECVKALIEMPLIGKGNRNNFLVTIALGLKDATYSEAEINEILERKAIEWNHDESLRAVKNKYRSLIKNDTKFSCDKVKMLFEEEGITLNCEACKKAISSSIYVSRKVIESIYNNKGAVRHFKAYLELEKENLLGKFFSLEDVNINIRTLNELEKLTNGKLEKNAEGLYKLTVKIGKAIYRLPADYIENAVDILNHKLGKVLMLIVKSCISNKYGVFVKISVIKMAEYLCFKNERSVYTFLKELGDLGFVTKNNTGVTIYYKSRKVINLEEEREARKEQVQINKDLKVVNGTQIKFDFEKIEASTNIPGRNFENNKINRIYEIRERRGSPPRPPN
ncbi:MAG: hypothetical protein NSGCLCUN01_03820 [uncultured Clostridium sp.]